VLTDIGLALQAWGAHDSGVKQESATFDPESLRRSVHEEIDHMEPARLVFLQQVMHQLEIDGLGAQLDREFDGDRAAGRLDPAAIQMAIREVRARHPYE